MKRLLATLLLLICLGGCQSAFDVAQSALRQSRPSADDVDYYRRIGREP